YRESGDASRQQHVARTIFKHRAQSWRRCRGARRSRSGSFQPPARLADLPSWHRGVFLLCAKDFAVNESKDLAVVEEIERTARSQHAGKVAADIARALRIRF